MKRLVLAGSLSLLAATAAAAPVTYEMDPNHTDVIASWSHFGFSNPVAHFGEVKGTIVYDAMRPAASSVEVTIPLAGLDSHVAKFDAHLRSADFFEADAYPQITFKSTRVEAAGKGKLKVSGDLTVKGRTLPAVLDVTINRIGEHAVAKRPAAGFDATTTLKRSAFGLGMAVPNVSDEVTIRITTEALAAKPAAPASTTR